VKRFIYALGLVLFVLVAGWFFKSANLNNFVNTIENRTFDWRQSIIAKSGVKKVNPNIKIIAIDDASYEYILNKYGEWPLPRDVYARLIDYLQGKNPKVIAFDLMFVNSVKNGQDADRMLTDSIVNNDNVFVAMNFDNQEEEVRTPIDLPENLAANVRDNSDIDFSDLTFTNCRHILRSIMDGTSNIGIVNVSRADDGVLREMPLFVRYKNKFYSELALKVYEKYIGKVSDLYVLSKENSVNIGGKNFRVNKDGSLILNWYGEAETFEYIPIYKLLKVVDEGGTSEYDFDGKILYFGTTAASLFDVKTVPTSRIFPGVEVQATYLNNLIDGNFINKLSRLYTLIISAVLAFFIIILVMQCSSVILATVMSVSVYALYLTIGYFVMERFNLWIEVIYPLIFAIVAFTCAYIIKYLIKSRDFDNQYKLATTDGLTGLYNHRYFQEQMKFNLENAKRYEHDFSLIIVDIDYFKRFNDTYGHQVGDAVLKLVSDTIKNNVRATDIVCRYGGEEISIILPKTDYEQAIFTANKLRESVEQTKLRVSGKEIGVTISLGVSTYPQNGEDAQTLIAFADGKLYLAKNSGRNKVGNEN